ncbi:hypothetical protein [Actinopolymorpha pittospori]
MLTCLDRDHGDVSVLAGRLGVVDWPTATQREHLEAAGTLRSEQLAGRFEDGVLLLEFDLPQSGAALIDV